MSPSRPEAHTMLELLDIHCVRKPSKRRSYQRVGPNPSGAKGWMSSGIGAQKEDPNWHQNSARNSRNSVLTVLFSQTCDQFWLIWRYLRFPHFKTPLAQQFLLRAEWECYECKYPKQGNGTKRIARRIGLLIEVKAMVFPRFSNFSPSKANKSHGVSCLPAVASSMSMTRKRLWNSASFRAPWGDVMFEHGNILNPSLPPQPLPFWISWNIWIIGARKVDDFDPSANLWEPKLFLSWHLHVLSPIVWPSPHWVTVFHSPARPLKNLPPLVHPRILLQVSVSSNISQWGVGVANCQFQPWRIGRTCSYHRPTLGVQEGTSQASHDLGAVVHVLGRVWCP